MSGNADLGVSMAIQVEGAGSLETMILGRARDLLASGDAAGARELLDGLIGDEPTSAAPALLRAIALQRLGEVDAAARDAATAVTLDPKDADGYIILASLFRELRRLDEAALFQWEALKLRPEDVGAYVDMAAILRTLDRPDAAAEVLEVALTVAPDAVDPVLSLIDHLMAAGQPIRAIEVGEQALARHPGDPRIMRNLGNALKWAGRREDAIELFEEILRINPDDGYARHMRDALAGRATGKADATYVQELFDGAADEFEEKLLTTLHYRVPGLMRQWAERVTGRKDLSVLDLGCGTGLCGVALSDMVSFMKGADLSPKMVEKAAAKGIYNDLAVAEIVDVLKTETRKYDLVVAGDVLVYFGDLSEVMRAVRPCLEPGGHFLFTVEQGDDDLSFALQDNARYTHGAGFVRRLASEAGYDVVAMDPQALRLENGRPVQGIVCVLGRGNA